MRIIIVEDSQLLASEMAKDVIARGHACTVMDTMAAYSRINKADYDFAVIDLSLPDSPAMQTIETVSKVGLPAVLMTVSLDEKILEAAGEAGYIVHPKQSSMPSMSAILANVVGLAKRDKARNRKLQLAYEQLERITADAPPTLNQNPEER